MGSCISLLFLAATRCQDLSTELTTACRRLPSDKLLLFISYLQPISLQVKLLQQTNTAPQLQLILSSVAKQLPSSSTEKAQHIPHQQEEVHTTLAQQPPSQQEREGHTTLAQQLSSLRSDVDTSRTDGCQSTKVQSPPCAIVLSQPVSRSVLKADLKIATLNSNKAQHSETTSLASNRFVAPPVRNHGQPNPKTGALSSTRTRPQSGPISHCRPTPLSTKTPATQPNPKTTVLSSTRRRPQCGGISHCRPTPLSTKTPATQSSSVKGLAHQRTTLSARSLSAIHKASMSSSSLQAKRFLSSGTHSSKVTAK